MRSLLLGCPDVARASAIGQSGACVVEPAVRLARNGDQDALVAIGAGGAGPLAQRRRRIDAWLGDRESALVVADDPVEGVVGTARVVRFGADEWWLHGVRVSAHARGRGLATAIWREATRLAGAHHGAVEGPGTLRLCCDSDNAAGHRLARGSGCVAVGDFVRLIASVGDVERPAAGSFEHASDRHLAAALRLLDDSPRFAAGDRLMFTRPVVGTVVGEERLRHLASAGRVHLWRPAGHRRPAAVVIHETTASGDGPSRRRELVVGVLEARDELLAAFAADVVELGRRLDCATASAFVADESARLAALDAAGWRPLPDGRGRGVIYRHRLAGGR